MEAPPGLDGLFISAARNGCLPVLQRLVGEFENGEGPGKVQYAKLKTKRGYNALHSAAYAGKTTVCRYLIEQLQFDINGTNDEGETPLFLAIHERHRPTTIFLIDNGADVTICTKLGSTPLHYAAKIGSKEIVEMLISKGADLYAIAVLGMPLHYAALSGNPDTLKCILAHKADPNPTLPSMHGSPLMFSLHAKSLECMELLLKAGADPNRLSYEETPLHYAAAKLDEEFIRRLLEAGANPNLISAGDRTPLEHAALHGRPEVVELLFPVTSRIACYPDWSSSSGVMRYLQSEEGRAQLNSKTKDSVLNGNTKGGEAFKRKNYGDAINWYTQAVSSDPTDAKAYSNRSLCFAKLGVGSGDLALRDAQTCVRLEPAWAKAHYREGAAWQLLKEFRKASESFSRALALEPGNREIQNAYRAAQAEHDKRSH